MRSVILALLLGVCAQGATFTHQHSSFSVVRSTATLRHRAAPVTAASTEGVDSVKLSVAWLPTRLAFAVNHGHKVGEGAPIPITRYFFHPRESALEQLKLELEARQWICSPTRDRLLAEATLLIDSWDCGVRYEPDAPTGAFPSICFLPVLDERQVDTAASELLTNSQRRRLSPTKPLVRARSSPRIREEEDEEEE